MCGASPVEFEVKFPRKQFPWLVRSHQVEFVVNYPVTLAYAEPHVKSEEMVELCKFQFASSLSLQNSTGVIAG